MAEVVPLLIKLLQIISINNLKKDIFGIMFISKDR